MNIQNEIEKALEEPLSRYNPETKKFLIDTLTALVEKAVEEERENLNMYNIYVCSKCKGLHKGQGCTLTSSQKGGR